MWEINNSHYAFCDELKAYMTGYERNYPSWKVKNTPISFLSPTQICPLRKWSISIRNAATVRMTSRRPSMTWPLAVCYSNHFGPMKPYSSWWCWLTIFSYCSRSTSWGQRNTDSRSRHSAWSTSFWPGRSSKQQEAWWWNSRKNIHIGRSMNIVCLDETHLYGSPPYNQVHFLFPSQSIQSSLGWSFSSWHFLILSLYAL